MAGTTQATGHAAFDTTDFGLASAKIMEHTVEVI